jgi:hypothetical protein
MHDIVLFPVPGHLDHHGCVPCCSSDHGDLSMIPEKEPVDPKLQATEDMNNAKAALAMGAGVGAVGTASALLIGATCPICVVMAPALIGMGLIKGYSARKKLKAVNS